MKISTEKKIRPVFLYALALACAISACAFSYAHGKNSGLDYIQELCLTDHGFQLDDIVYACVTLEREA